MEETYGNATASYVSGIPGPMRSKYPRAMAEKELIHSLTKVLICSRIYGDNFDIKQGDQLYNAYEKDIALVNIYFGDSTVLGIKHFNFKSIHELMKYFAHICLLC